MAAAARSAQAARCVRHGESEHALAAAGDAVWRAGPLLSAFISVTGTADRVGAVADARLRQLQSENLYQVPASLVLSEAEKALAIAEANARRECSSERGSKCSGLENRLKAIRNFAVA